jgi:hypothetical protein
MKKVVLVGGTGRRHHRWIEDPCSPFRVMLKFAGIEPATVGGRLFEWNGKLSGVPFINRGLWEDESFRLVGFMVQAECYDVIAHSHGGQLAIWAAKRLSGFRRVHSLTTVGTPVRHDVPAVEAAKNIDVWQHLHDRKGDRIATLRKLGQLFDGQISLKRYYEIPGVRNIAVDKIAHSKILNEPDVMVYWPLSGWLDPILRRKEETDGRVKY